MAFFIIELGGPLTSTWAIDMVPSLDSLLVRSKLLSFVRVRLSLKVTKEKNYAKIQSKLTSISKKSKNEATGRRQTAASESRREDLREWTN